MRRAILAAVATAATMVALAGCSGSGGGESDMANDAPAAPAPAEEQGGGSADDASGDGDAAESDAATGVITDTVQAAAGRDIIYTIDLSITTDDVDAAAQRAATIATGAGGFVADEQTSGGHALVTLRIPTAEHAAAVSELESLGEVTDRYRTTDDVTDEVVDTESRIASQRGSIARIRALLDQATDLEQIITIESELATREADLDALLSRQEELSALTSMATVTVTFSTPDEAPEEEPDNLDAGFLGGLKDGWNAFATTMTAALTIIGAALPFLVVLAAIAGVVLWWRRRRTGADVAPAQPAQSEAPSA